MPPYQPLSSSKAKPCYLFLKLPPLQLNLFPARIQNRHHEHGDNSQNHSSEGWNSHGDHNVGPAAYRCQNRQQSKDSCCRGHHGRTHSSFPTFNHGCPNLRDGLWVILFKTVFQKEATKTPSSVAMPNKARNPTQTATLRLSGFMPKRSCMLVPKTLKSMNQDCP